MKPGFGLSVLAERVGEGSWALPLGIAWIPLEHGPTSFDSEQIKAFVKAHVWTANYVLDVDSQYTVRPFLKPVVGEGVNVLGRVLNNRCFYLPIKQYSGFGRPAHLGAKFKINDPKTHPRTDRVGSWKLGTGGRIEVRCWLDVLQKGLALQSLTLYQVIEYRADGKRRYLRPLWLLFVASRGRTAETRPAQAPTTRQTKAIYDERFSVEQFIRFEK